MRVVLTFLALLAVSGYARAQSLSGGKLDGGYIGPVVVGGAVLACDIGPFTSATPFSTVSAQINGAADGKVVCLARGQTWSTSAGMDLTVSHANSARVTVCGSTVGTCTDTGLPNPKLSITALTTPGNGSSAQGSMLRCASGAGGFDILNIDAEAPLNNGNMGVNLIHGCSNLTVAGGTLTSFEHWGWMDMGGGAPPNNVKIGTCANPQTWTDSGANNRGLGLYGTCTNCSLSVNVTGVNVSEVGNGQSHVIDIASNQGQWQGSSAANGLTVECSTFDGLTSTFGGTIIKAACGSNGTFQDNTFTGGCIHGSLVGFDSHGLDSHLWGWDTAVVRRNKATFTCGDTNKLVSVGIGSHISIENNIVKYPQSGDTGPAIHLNCHDGNPGDNFIVGVTAINNTIQRTGNGVPDGFGGFGQAILGDKGEGCGSGRPAATDLVLKNNLILANDANPPTVLVQAHGTCNDYQTNGSGIDSNFLWQSGVGTPSFLSCTGDDGGAASAWPKSGPTNGADGFATDPLLVDIANMDFRLVSATSRLYKNGVGTPGQSRTCVATDRLGNPQTNPCTIGANSNVP